MKIGFIFKSNFKVNFYDLLQNNIFLFSKLLLIIVPTCFYFLHFLRRQIFNRMNGYWIITFEFRNLWYYKQNCLLVVIFISENFCSVVIMVIEF